MKNTILFLFLILLTACQNETINYADLNFFGENQRQYAFDNNIKVIKYIKVNTDETAGVWKRLEYVEHYDKKGLLTKRVSYGYKSTKNEQKVSIFDMLESNTETNITNGVIDTAYYFYDRIGRLIKSKSKGVSRTIEYDRFNNKIKECHNQELDENLCNYHLFEYSDEKGKIKTRRDSIGIIGGRSSRVQKLIDDRNLFKHNYNYDELGRVVFDGSWHRKYNRKNQIVEISDAPDKNFSRKFIINYDNTGNIASEIEISSQGTYAGEKYIAKSYDTIHISANQYNENNIKIEMKDIEGKNILTRLIKLEHEFY